MSILPTFLSRTDMTGEPVATTRQPPREYELDLSTGQLTGRIVEGLDAIKVWVWNCLKTERYRYPIYSWQYGCEYEQYFGEIVPDDWLQGDCKTETEEALRVNPWITGITDFEASMEGSHLRLSFTLETAFGEAEVETYV